MEHNLRGRAVVVALTVVLLSAGFWTGLSRAQSQASVNATAIDVDRGAAGLTRALRSLRTRASILHVTAHPDDEDGGMLAYETRGQGARGVLLTLNRGEGGQNAMSMDMYDALGLVRTQELLMADRYYGVEQYWTRAIDYGFSKTREEALDKWSHDRVLSDVVRVVRMTRPLVITSVFVSAASDGHGHHQVAGQMAQEAYLAAGDPTKFPEQIREGLRPWTPLKVYARVPNFAITKEGMYDYAIDKYVPVRFFDYVNQKASDTKPSVTLEIPEGDYAPASGLTYWQIARTGWGFQKSQNGGGVTPPPAEVKTAYHRYGSRIAAADREASFFDGVDVSLAGIAALATGDTKFLKDGLGQVSRRAEDAFNQFSVDRPAAIAPALAEGLKSTRALLDQVRKSQLAEPGKDDLLFELGVKEQQFQSALALALGVNFQAVVAAEKRPEGPGGPPGPAAQQATFTIAIPGQAFSIDTKLFNPSPETLGVEDVEVTASDGKKWTIRMSESQSAAISGAQPLPGGKEAQWKFAATAPPDAALTRPYFTRPDEEQAYSDLTDERYRNLSLAPYPLSARARISYQGVAFEIERVVQANRRIPGIGMVADPLLVGPAISVTVSPSAGAIPVTAKSFDFSSTIHNNVKGPARGVLKLKLPPGWRSTPPEAPFSFDRDGEERTVTFSVSPDLLKPIEYTITALAEYGGRTYQEGYRLAGYDGLRLYPFYRPARYRAVGVDVKTAPGLTIGFLPGTGDDVPRALENLGQNVRVLASSDLTQGDLSRYDAVILGVRAYAVRADLKTANGRLLDYVRNGGVLIVQYNLQDFDHDYGPYPFVLGQNPQKVVDETSPVTLLDPRSPAFTWPNQVSEADFKGWVEERGHGFLKSWDSRYQPLVETHDPDQDPQKGGLLLARYGKGFYVYDAFALYRQLPSGVPGSYRLLANLISLGKNPEWK
jgi:LmbE family N-acetylglucosaminyl deacetylase